MSVAVARLDVADVQRVRISDITVGVRRRKSVGGLASLMKSIEAHGLIHPILLRNGEELVAGGRRLAACQKLGMTHIPARSIDGMTDEELRAIEVDENAERLGLNDFDSSKARLAEIRQAEADAKRAADEVSAQRAKTSEKPKGGRPSVGAVSRRAVAEITGIPDATQRKIAAHVATAEEYPALQRPGWVQHQVLHAGALLEKLPVPDRPKAAAMLDQDALPPRKAITILENLAELPAPERKSIFKLAQSGDAHERTTALTRALELPDPVDPGLTVATELAPLARKAARLCRHPEFKARLSAVADMTASLLKDFDDWNRKERNHV